MDLLESKRLALLRILEILRKHSDEKHPMTQDDIIRRLQADYGVEIERKAVGRCIALLKDAGYEINSSRSGSYLALREFEDSELRLLIDGVLSSKYINARHSRDLIERLCSMSNKYFRSHIKHIFSVNDWGKTDNQQLFYNIEVIDEAIEGSRQIKFDYNKYGTDKRLHKSAVHTVSPYQLILHNQRYYLMALNEKYKNIGFYKLDHITGISIENLPLTPITEIKGYERGINYKELSGALPYMYTDQIETVELVCDEIIIDQVIDWFGREIDISKPDGGKLRVRLKASPNAMEHWAMQYIKHVEVIKPVELRERIKNTLSLAQKKYSNP